MEGRSPAKRVERIRLDVLKHDSLPNQGPGRSGDGTFVLTGFQVSLASENSPKQRLPLRRVTADYTQPGHNEVRLIRDQGSWAIFRFDGPLRNQTLVAELDQPLNLGETDRLAITLRFESVWSRTCLGHFRLQTGESRD